MQFVVNEWLLEYLTPNADEDNFKKVNKFIEYISGQSHKIVIGRKNPFITKFYKFSKEYSWNESSNKNFKKLHNLLFRDSERTLIIEDNELYKIPEELKNKTHSKDIYLIELALSTEDKIIITTDSKLKEMLKDVNDLNIELLDDFLNKID